jgi:hypothetical protein
MKRQGVTESPTGKWTTAEDYLGAMARKRTFRKKQGGRGRTEPEAPALLLSTIPFLALLGLLAVLAVGIMITAFPGNQPSQKASLAAPREQGVAAKGWLQEAQREFHH